MDPTKGPNRALSKNNNNTQYFFKVNSYRLRNMGPITAIDGYVLDFTSCGTQSVVLALVARWKMKAVATSSD